MIPFIVTAELVPLALPGPVAVHYAMVGFGELLVVAIVFGSLTTLFFPMMRALARRMEGGTSATSPSLHNFEERLDRIERGMEAIAVEVERVSEGQRFVTKLLAEKASPPLPSANP